jgi:hypothetical protein
MLYRQFKTQEELDDEYRPEARITDPTAFDKLIEKRRTLSASAKAELTRKADLRYGPTLIERLDVYPAAEPNAPIVIFIHGGYWFDARLTKDMYVWVAKGFVGHGVTTVIVDYEVLPQGDDRRDRAAMPRSRVLRLSPCRGFRQRQIAHLRHRQFGRRPSHEPLRFPPYDINPPASTKSRVSKMVGN